MIPRYLVILLLACPTGLADETPGTPTEADPINSALQEIHNLRAERTRLRIHHRESHPRFAEIDTRIAAIHDDALRQFETVATSAALECSEEPRYGQPSYGVILYASSVEDIAANELLLFHAGRVYRAHGLFRKLTTTGAGWYFKPNVNIPEGTKFVVACIQDAPEEIQNVKNGFMPNSNRARQPHHPYRTEIFRRDGKPLLSGQ